MQKTKKPFLILICFIIVSIGLIRFFIWYEFEDVTGLNFYDYEEIEKVYLEGSIMCLITKEKNVFVSGDWNSSASRKYRNVLGHSLSKTNVPPPVKIFEGNARDIKIYDDCILILTEENELYKIDYSGLLKINDKIKDAVKQKSQNSDIIFAVNENDDLIVMESEHSIIIMSDVKQIAAFENQLFVLKTDGTLTEYSFGESFSDLSFHEIIYHNVEAFDIEDTSKRTGEDKSGQEKLTYNNALFTVMTRDNTVYVRGAYNLLMGPLKLTAPSPEPHVMEDWMLIGENVSQYSSNFMGTIMLHEDKTVSYYGENTIWGENSWLGKKEFDLNNAVFVEVGMLCICIQLSDGNLLFWGEALYNRFCSLDGKPHHLKDDEPSVFSIDSTN